jgi:hypothetical protein
MDLNEIIISQIGKVVREEEIKREAVRKRAEEATEVKAKKEAEERAKIVKENQKNFELNKTIFEESFVREVMAVIIAGLKDPNNKGFLPLREKIGIASLQDQIKGTTKFFLEEPKPFDLTDSYLVLFFHGTNDLMDFFVKNGQIQIQKTIHFPSLGNRKEILSFDKESVAKQIISFLMTD